MQLHSVFIANYKNLHNLTIDFDGCGGLIVIAGLNGSGKSNFLEALALIFAEIKGQITNANPIDEYKLSYSIDDVKYEATKKEGVLKLLSSDRGGVLKKPDKIISVYCGESSRLEDCGFVNSLEDGLLGGLISVSMDDFELALLCALMTSQPTTTASYSIGKRLGRPVEISYLIANSDKEYPIPPEKESDSILITLANKPSSDSGRKKLSFVEFIQAFSESIHNWEKIEGSDVYVNLSQLLAKSEYSPFVAGINVVFEDEAGARFDASALSEGEKHLAIYEVIYRNLADSSTLVLLDEPDAYVHESKKRDLVDFISNNTNRGVFTVLTTHSPNIVNAIRRESLVGLEVSSDGNVLLIDKERFDVFAQIVDNRMESFSAKPIMLFEGKSDIILLKKAVAYFRQKIDGYERISIDVDFDYYLMGGTGNAVYWYEEMKRICGSRRVFVVLDHDDAGKKQIAKFKELEREQTLNIFVRENNDPFPSACDCAFLIPPPVGYTGDTYMIEDYLPKEYYHRWIDNWKEQKVTCFHTIVDFMSSLKREIGNKSTQFNNDELRGFQPLIDVILSIPNSSIEGNVS